MKIIKKRNNELQLQDPQLKLEEIDFATETMSLLAEQLLELLLQQIGDPNTSELILTMCIDMLSSYSDSKPIFRKGGKLQREI